MSGDVSLAQSGPEPLQLTGHIQPHGALMILDDQGLITHVSENIGAFLAGGPSAWLDTLAPACLREWVRTLPDTPGARAAGTYAPEDRAVSLDLVASRGPKGGVALELTRPGPEAEVQPRDWAIRAGWDPQDCQGLVDAVAEFTGFERVMYDRFLDNGDGEVIAAARRGGGCDSCLGLRFPASDVPHTARHLYLSNPWRWIPDAVAEPVPILSRDFELPYLAWTDLRSVSPVQREYLGNLGARAALSFPVVVHGELHALVICHHSSPGCLARSLLERVSQVVMAHALAVSGKLALERLRLDETLEGLFRKARTILERHGNVMSAWPELAPWLMATFEADGAMLCGPGAHVGSGLVLVPEALAALDASAEWLGDRKIWMSDRLVQDVPGFPRAAVAGVLVVRASRGVPSEGSIVLTREAQVQDIQWGGNPLKPSGGVDAPVNPALPHGLEKRVERRTDFSRPWGRDALLKAHRLSELLL